MTAAQRMWAIVPVKRFSAAKRRLAPVLAVAERKTLARLMFEDVLDALRPCRSILAGIVVVTSDPDAMDIARRCGAAVVLDKRESGVNAAIGTGLSHIDVSSDDAVVVVPSDIPQVTGSAFLQAAAALRAPRSLVIAAAVQDGGTNLFACRPVRGVTPHFGQHSFERHRRAAQQSGIPVQILRLPELALDIDRPDDLSAFLALGSRTRTHDFLSALAFTERPNDVSRSLLLDSPVGKVGS